MRSVTHRPLGVAAIALAASLVTVTPADAETQLRLSHYASTASTTHEAAQFFADEVEKRTDGELTVSVHPANELGNGPDQVRGLRLGTLDMAVVGNTFFTAVIPELAAFDLPYLFASREHAYEVLDGEIGSELLSKFEDNRMKVLGNWEIGFRNITNNVRPIETPADLAGINLRVNPNKTHVAAFEAWGANPTPINFSELYLALETGSVDGQENPVVLIEAMRFNEVQEHLSLTRHAYTGAFLAMNKGIFDGLSGEHQDVLTTVGREAGQMERDLNAVKEGGALDKMRDAGLKVVEDPDRDAFREMVVEITRKGYVDEFGDELLTRIDDAH